MDLWVIFPLWLVVIAIALSIDFGPEIVDEFLFKQFWKLHHDIKTKTVQKKNDRLYLRPSKGHGSHRKARA
jgi:hypothetical protein